MNMTNKERIRKARVNILIETFKKAKKEGKGIDEEKIISEIQYEFGTSRRTALEYMKIAKSRLEL